MDGAVDQVPFKGRREDERLLKGAGRYTADWSHTGQMHAAFLRADHAHARIERIDITAAAAAPGVLAVLTADDMTEAGYMRGLGFMPFRDRNGEGLKASHSPALAHNRVRFVGEAVALVVAETAHAAQDAVELINVQYDDLSAVVDAHAALASGAPVLHDAVPGNVCFDFRFGDDAAVKAASPAHRMWYA